MNFDEIYMQAAIAQAKKSLREGGIPIGASLAIDNTIVGLGHNRRVQQNDPILHGETDCIRNAGRLTAEQYRSSTIYTTLSPCPMCSGTILLFGIPRVVIAENVNFMGAEELLKENGVHVIVTADEEMEAIMANFIKEHPELWNEDIGETA
ncbi:MAG: nucleoside deaminase [Planctomycetota bacterium]